MFFIKWICNLLRPKELRDVLDRSVKVKIKGVIFTIKPIRPYDHLRGFQAVAKEFQTYEDARISEKKPVPKDFTKLYDHYKEIFLASVIKPQLSMKEDCGEQIYVMDLFDDFELAELLYRKIMEITYGKKKIRSTLLQNRV